MKLNCTIKGYIIYIKLVINITVSGKMQVCSVELV
uniref:Uncharacterized protein n=1 Tax=Anguilla anguilla TaxID=7936 RepID=A0A0E9VCR9_ANGAN